MDEVEEGRLEQRLRRSVAGHQPAAPEWLVGFIETVPARHRTAGRLALAFDRPRVRRGAFATVVVAAALLAIVGSATLVAVRNGQNAEPGAPSLAGWTWQKADGTNVNRPYQVANGYMGSCGQDATLCTSPDGLHWTTPADPSIVAVDGGAYFVPNTVARIGGIYVATSESSSMANPSCAPDALTCSPTTVMWRSADGLHWNQVDSPTLSGLTLFDVSSLSGFFVAYTASVPDETGWALTSTDGAAWVRASRLPVQPGISSSGASGVQVGSTNAQWRTLDGKNWTQMTVPAGWTVGVVYAIPSGGFVGLGMSQSQSTNSYQIFTSPDGLTWRIDAGDLQGVPLALDSVGGRLFADVSASPLNASAYPDSSTLANAFEIWQSADWGRTWQPLLDSSGNQMSGLVTTVGGRLFISSADPAVVSWRIAWVGTPPAMSPEVPVTPAATGSSEAGLPPTTPGPVVPAATGPVPAPTAVVPVATVPGAAGPAPTSGEVSQPTPPVTPGGGISQADAIRLAAAALADSPNAAPSSAAQVEAGQASLVYGNPLEVQPQARWVWLVTYGAQSGTGSGGAVAVDYITGVVVGMESWTP